MPMTIADGGVEMPREMQRKVSASSRCKGDLQHWERWGRILAVGRERQAGQTGGANGSGERTLDGGRLSKQRARYVCAIGVKCAAILAGEEEAGETGSKDHWRTFWSVGMR
jgi:hypothetical protein